MAKWSPIHLSATLIENDDALQLNLLVAFAFSLKHILNVNISNIPSTVTKEFLYTLSRRHTNQETLGLAYDMIEFAVNKI